MTLRSSATAAGALLLFGIAFGFVEAAVVVYLRQIYDPLRAQVHPGAVPGDLFPLLRIDDLRQAGAMHMRLLAVEVARELATLAMLAAVGIAVGRTAQQRLAAFSVAFGVWDIAFYAFLKLVLDWPASLLTWDLLFLIPVPWAGPVLAPVLISAAMIVCGYALLFREWAGRPVRTTLAHWAGVVAGGLIAILSFTLDCRNLMAGGMPESYPWWLLAAGLGAGVFSFAAALRR